MVSILSHMLISRFCLFVYYYLLLFILSNWRRRRCWRGGEGSHKILCSKTWGIGLKKEKNCPGIELWEIVCQVWSAGIGVMCNVSRAQTFSCCDADSPRSTVSKIDRSGPEQPPPHSSRQRVLLGKHYTDSFHLVALHTLLFFT